MHYWRPLHGLRMKGEDADLLERDLVQVVQGTMCRPGHGGGSPSRSGRAGRGDEPRHSGQPRTAL